MGMARLSSVHAAGTKGSGKRKRAMFSEAPPEAEQGEQEPVVVMAGVR